MNCLICDRIKVIKRGDNPFFVKELRTGLVVLGDHQYYKGYTLLLCKKHVSELHELDKDYRKMFLKDMSLVAEAVFKAFHPAKLNYELLGNTEPHLHWHIFPRYADDPTPQGPVWYLDKEVRRAKKTIPTERQLKQLKKDLLVQLDNLLK